jgi:hypothetical protein
MHTQPVEKAILFVGVMYPKRTDLKKILDELVKKYGKISIESKEFPFTFTNYYAPELGEDIVKKFFVFEKKIDRSKIGIVKIFTNKIEDKCSVDGKRSFNLDPGYFNKTQLVLASAKESSHKIYLGKGMFAHLTYTYANKQWMPTERCFPDFKSEEVKKFFAHVRENV